MEKRVSGMLNSGLKVYFLAMALFIAVTAYLRAWLYAGIEAGICLIRCLSKILTGSDSLGCS